MGKILYHVALPSGEAAMDKRKALIDKIVQPTFAADPDYRMLQAEGAELKKICMNIRTSAFIIADTSVMDACIYYQLGYADGVGTPVIFLREKEDAEWYQPVDIRGRWYMEYRLEESKQIVQIRKALWETATADSDEDYSGSRYKYAAKKSDDDENACFMICPIGEEGSSRREKSDAVMEMIVNEALRGYKEEGALRGDHSVHLRQIGADVRRQIAGSDFCIADLSELNPNVYYELGYAHALKKRTILIKDKAGTLPALMAGLKCIDYNLEDLEDQDASVMKIREAIRAGKEADEVSAASAPDPAFLEAVESGSVDWIEEELKSAFRRVNEKQYLLEYLPAAAEAGSWEAIRQMSGHSVGSAFNPYKVINLKYASLKEKTRYFEVVTNALLGMRVHWEEPLSLFESLYQLGRPYLAGEIDACCSGMNAQLDIVIRFDLWGKKHRIFDEKNAWATGSFAMSRALLKYRMYLNAPWRDRLLKKAVKSLKHVLEFDSGNWAAHYLIVVWALRIDENSWSGDYMNIAAEHLDKLLEMTENERSADRIAVLKLAIRCCQQFSDRVDFGDGQKQLEAELAQLSDVDEEFFLNWIPEMPDRNDALMWRKRSRTIKFFFYGFMAVGVLALGAFWWNQSVKEPVPAEPAQVEIIDEKPSDGEDS